MAALIWPPVAERKSEDVGRKKLRLPFHSLALCYLRTHEGEAYWKEPGGIYGRAWYQAAFGGVYPPHLWSRLYCALDCIKTFSLKLKLEELEPPVGSMAWRDRMEEEHMALANDGWGRD